MPLHRANVSDDPTPIHFVTAKTWPAIRETLSAAAIAFAEACGFEPSAGKLQIVPDDRGGRGAVLFGLDERGKRPHDPFLPGRLPTLLPPGLYRFANAPHDAALAALAWLLADYRFTRYNKRKASDVRLCAPPDVDAAQIDMIADAVMRGRDLVNTPTNDLGPAALEQAALALAKRHKAKAGVIRGDDLLKRNMPLIHAVGRAAAEPPRLVDFTWGDTNAPKITLVGKGVCFDTGGLDIKPSAGMLMMKKDMGGAATALALADMIMAAGLPVRLRVLVPIVENSIAGNAFRPGDVYPSRKGLTVEIGNTDAEGRLILADALALADEEAPDLIFDFATLTGAARVALGPDLPPFYTMDDELAAAISACGTKVNDPVWRMPLWEPYDKLMDGKIADLCNVSSGPFAGSVTAALFLRRFVERAKAWAHFDIYAWVPSTKPGRPEGAEIQAARLLFDLLETRYGAQREEASKKPGTSRGKTMLRKAGAAIPGRALRS